MTGSTTLVHILLLKCCTYEAPVTSLTLTSDDVSPGINWYSSNLAQCFFLGEIRLLRSIFFVV